MNQSLPGAATILAVGSLFLIGLALILLFFVNVPTSNATIVAGIVGYIAGWVSAAVSFFFGSSKSSEDKNKTIGDMATALTSTGSGTTPAVTTTTTTETKTP